MQKNLPLQIHHLRKIGWDHWDPIGIRAFGNDDWQTKAADEYDSYLIKAADRLGRDWHIEEAVEFLVHIERDYMGLGMQPTTIDRAKATAAAIRKYIDSL